MNRKITSHERMKINGRYYIHEGGQDRLQAEVWLAERENHIHTGLYLNETGKYGAGDVRVYCPRQNEMVIVGVNVIHGKVEIVLSGGMQGVEIKDERRTKGGEEE